MSVSKLSSPNVYYSEQTVVLSDLTFRLTYRFNSTESRWYLDVVTLDGKVEVYGIKIMPDANLFETNCFKIRGTNALYATKLTLEIDDEVVGLVSFEEDTQLVHFDRR